MKAARKIEEEEGSRGTGGGTEAGGGHAVLGRAKIPAALPISNS